MHKEILKENYGKNESEKVNSEINFVSLLCFFQACTHHVFSHD